MKTVLWDSREKVPLVERLAERRPSLVFEAATLKAGDYAVKGRKTADPVELKRGHDWARCCSSAAERKRWRAQIEALVGYAKDPLIVFTWPPSYQSVKAKTRGKNVWYRPSTLWENFWEVQGLCRAVVVGTDAEAAELILEYWRKGV